ncbi:hypothetical protein [Segatella copri]|uniref:hypothetical protein n=1 Tax=Segatella copri TaxID=165179 RepID=UPI001C4953BD|nr:hypothetical protein [Segatella copri]MBW0026011.1 hypothetical protein [Segatella copri]
MIGLSQRAIIIAKNGGKIRINEGVCMSGCTIYSMKKIVIGRNTDIGSGCKIIDNLLAELKNRLKISIFLWRKSCASR